MKLWLLLIVSSVLLLKTVAAVYCKDAIGPNPSLETAAVTLTFGCSYDTLTVAWEAIYDYEYGNTYLESVNYLQYTCYDINGTEVMADGLYDDIPEVDSIGNSAEASIIVNLPQTAVKCNITGCYTRSDMRYPYLFTPKSCDVTGARPAISPLPNKTEVWAGSNFNLTCPVTGNPQPVVTWEKDGEPFDPGLYPNVTYLNGELVFHEANEEVSGNYSCVATNFLGNETSEPIIVIVMFEHPTINNHPLSKTVNESSNISLMCEVSGHPQPIISWEKDGQPFDPELYSNVFYLDEGEILIDKATENFTGVYVCVATNSLGNSTSDPATIDILRPSTSSAVVVPIKSSPMAVASTPITPPIPTSTPAGPPIPTSTPVISSLQTSTPTPTNSPGLPLASAGGKDDTDIFIIIGLVVGIVLVLLLAVFITFTLVTRMCMPRADKFVMLKRTKVPPFWADFIQPETIIDPNFAPVDIYPTVVVVSTSCESIFDSLLLDLEGRRLSKEDIKQLSTSEDLPQPTNVTVLKHLQDESTRPKSPNESTISAEKSSQEPPSTDNSGIQRESPCPVLKASTSSCYDHLENKVSDNPVDKDFNGELLMDVQRLTNTHTSQGGYVYNECDLDSGLNLELAATVGALSEDIPLQLHYNNTLDGFNETLSEHQCESTASSFFPSTEDTEDEYMWIHSSKGRSPETLYRNGYLTRVPLESQAKEHQPEYTDNSEQSFMNNDDRTQEIVHREGYLSRVPLESQTPAVPMHQDNCPTYTVSDIPIVENCQIDSQSRMTPVQVPLFGLASDQDVTYVRYSVAASSCSGYVSDASICTDYSQDTFLPIRNVSSGCTDNNSELDVMNTTKEGYLSRVPLESHTKAVPMHQDICPTYTVTVSDIPIAENCQIDSKSHMTPVQVPLFGLASDDGDQCEDVGYTVTYSVAASSCSGYVSETDYSKETVLPVCSVSSGYVDTSELDFYNRTESDHHLSRYSSPSGYIMDESSHPGMQQV